MRIRNLEIGVTEPCRIIAEIGTLHLPDYDNMIRATAACIHAGADMVKTQMINHRSAWWAKDMTRQRYKRLEWLPEQWAKFLREANAISEVPVFASLFDEWFLTDEVVNESPAFKIGYKATLMPELFCQVVGTGKPVFVSIKEPTNLIFSPQVGFLYVIPEYPITLGNVRLPLFGYNFLGASLHTKDLDVLGAAMMLGAQTLEVHVQAEGASGPDTEFALTIPELQDLIRFRDELNYLRKNHKRNKINGREPD